MRPFLFFNKIPLVITLNGGIGAAKSDIKT